MPTNDQIRAMIERLEYLGDHASFEPSAHHDSAAMLRELLAERKWRDMDSAPRDGTRFLAWGSYDYPGDKAPTTYTDIVEYSGDAGYPWRTFEDGNHPSCSFTKWLPLPTPGGGE